MKVKSKKDFIINLGTIIEIFVLLSLIILNVLDFLGLLTEEFDFIKKIISWTGLLLILKSAHLSKIFFGIKDKIYDIWFPISLFILSFKDFMAFVNIAHEEFEGFLKFIIDLFFLYSSEIQTFTLYIGLIMLVFWSFYVVIKMKTNIGEKTSIYKLIKKKYSELGALTILKVFLLQYIFFVIFFNMFIEWLAISVDSAVFTLGFIMFLLYRNKFEDGAINSLSSFGEEFYERVIKLFKYKNGLNFGIMLMYLLHLLTDIAIFIIPFVMFISNPLYMEDLSELTHESVVNIFFFHNSIGLSQGIVALFVHLISILFIAQLLLYPLIIFLSRLQYKKIEMNSTNIALFFSTMAGFFSYSLIKIFPIKTLKFVGVDFQHSLIASLDYSKALFSIFLVFIVFFAIKFLLDYIKINRIKDLFNSLIEFIVSVFVVIYFSMYIYSNFYFLIEIIRYIARLDLIYFFFIFFFILTTILFYIYTTLIFLKEVFGIYFLKLVDICKLKK